MTCRLIETSDGEDGGVGQFLVEKFNGAHGHGTAWIPEGEYQPAARPDWQPAHVRMTGSDAASGKLAQVSTVRLRAVPSTNRLEHGALLIVSGHDDDG